MRLEFLKTFRYHWKLVFKGIPVGWVTRSNAARWVKSYACKLGLASLTTLILASVPIVQARGIAADPAQVELSSLPREAQQTQRLILVGGPFPYPRKDGIVFGNRERSLPRHERGFYREYTVPTPGSRDRGARRIICGGRQPTQPEACFYTDDHYASFKRIAR